MSVSQFVVFRLEDELYGVPIASVERILKDQVATRIPRTPKVLLGVFDLRGETVPALDGRLRFEFSERSEPGRFIVLATSSGRCALRVDAVDGIVSLDESQVETTPDVLRRADDDFVRGVGKDGDRLIVLLETDHVVPTSLRKHVGKPELAAA